MQIADQPPRSALFLPASNPRAMAKAPTLACDLAILDLEDAVKAQDKAIAREAAITAAAGGFGDTPFAVRINGADSSWHEHDVRALAGSAVKLVVLPKVERPGEAQVVVEALGKPVLAMIETPAGVLAAPAIAASPGVHGLIAGTNDLAAALRLPASSGRAGLGFALQSIVLAARAAGKAVLDGVWNALDDPAGLTAECEEGRRLGFDGKTLIHPGQIEIANRVFGPSEAELEEARALVAAATGGAERFRDRMIEAMHVEAARRLIARAGG